MDSNSLLFVLLSSGPAGGEILGLTAGDPWLTCPLTFLIFIYFIYFISFLPFSFPIPCSAFSCVAFLIPISP